MNIEIKKYYEDIAVMMKGNILAQVITVISLPIITRIFSPLEYGKFAYTLQLIGLLSIILAVRLETVLAMLTEEEKSKKVASIIPIVTILSSFIVYMIIQILSLNNIKAENLKILERLEKDNLIIVLIISMIIVTSNGVQNYLQKKQDYKKSIKSEIMQKGSFAFGAICLGYLVEPKEKILIYALLISYFIKLIMLYKSSSIKYFDIMELKLKENIEILKSIIKPALSTAISHGLLIITTFAPIYFIEKKYGAESLGQFTLAWGTVFLPSIFISNSIGQVYFERANYIHQKKDNISRLFEETIIKLMLTGIIPMAIVVIYGELIYTIIFGENWTESGKIASILSIAAYLCAISSAVDRTCLVVGKVIYGPIWHLLRAVMSIIICMTGHQADLEFYQFLIYFSSSITLLYLVDVLMQKKYSKIIKLKRE